MNPPTSKCRKLRPSQATPLVLLLVLLAALSGAQPSARADQSITGKLNTVKPTKALLGISHVQLAREHSDLNSAAIDIRANNNKPLNSLRTILMRHSYGDCCPHWQELVKSPEVATEIRTLHGRSWTNRMVVGDLLIQLRSVFVNITYLSIEGQSGSNEWERYYNFYDAVQYYLRLMRVADDYLESLNKTTSGVLDPSGKTEDEFRADQRLARYVKSIHYKIEHDPTMSSFMAELFETPFSNRTNLSNNSNSADNSTQPNAEPNEPLGGREKEAEQAVGEEEDKNFVHLNSKFEFYEDFIGATRFGRYYASNISMIREYVEVFDRVLDHVTRLKLTSNYTRPSLQYMMLRRLSYELFHLKHELDEKISPRIMQNRADLREMVRKLNELVVQRHEVKLLGDEFDTSGGEPNFSTCVRQLTSLLDRYTTNNLTQRSFYEKLSELPEEFIILGASIGRDYEAKEVPMYEHYDKDLFGWNYASRSRFNLGHDFGQSGADHHNSSPQNTSLNSTDARNSNLSLLARLFT